MSDNDLDRVSRELSDYIRSEPDLADAFGMTPAKTSRAQRDSDRKIRKVQGFVERHPDDQKAKAMLWRLLKREGKL